MAIRVHLEEVLRERGMTSKELCAKVGITEANLSILRSGKAKELMALCVYQNGRPVSIHEIVENLWGENGDGAGYRRTIKELADTLRDYGAEEMFLRSRGSLRVRMDLADSDYQDFMGGDEDAICQFQGEFMQQYSWAEPMVYTLQEKKELMLARMGKRHMQGGG